ncbi:prolyl oligopeptidase family serine peptidase [Streptomyces sp. NPDC005438]|uniref:alpha/beta hydrolase family protein n=1 Tax=Streptomyces sp. NPDC005438 TaxID=3156880 RepID=UPI0033A3CBF0
MRPWNPRDPKYAATWVAAGLLGAGAAALAAGRYATHRALNPARPSGGVPLPAGFTRAPLVVHEVRPAEEGRPATVALSRSLWSQLPGTYGLAGSGSHAVVGPPLAPGPGGASPEVPADVVLRPLERVSHGELRPGDRVWLTPQVYAGNPRDALDLDHADVDVPGELGPLPAWFVPGFRSTWVLAIHGLGATREHPMVVLPTLHGLRLPVLDLARRGDPGAPVGPDAPGRPGSGAWHDVDAALRYAVAHGAQRVVLMGWSTGAAMALHTAASSPLRNLVSGLVLDSPVLDWPHTVRALAAQHHVPGPLVPWAVRGALSRTRDLTERWEAAADPGLLTVPTLLLHGPGDEVADWHTSLRFAAARPELVSLQEIPDAPHGAMWNADPAGYQEALRRFLTPLL